MASDRKLTVLLTGASSGIGLETARLLAARRCEVWGTSRDVARLPQFPGFHPVCMDLAKDETIRAAFTLAERDAGGFDVLINNAGSGLFGSTTDISDELTREMFQTLVHGPLELIRLAAPAMRRRPRGLIINITSLAGAFPVPYMAAYSAAKAALGVFSRCLRLEFAGTAIQVVDVQPADIHTRFHDSTKRITAADTDRDQAREEAAWETQQRNMAAAPPPERVAAAVWRIVQHPNPPPVVVVGGLFQARLAPLAARFLPGRCLEWMLRRYYRI